MFIPGFVDNGRKLPSVQNFFCRVYYMWVSDLAQSGVSLTANPGALARPYTFMEIYHEIISRVILPLLLIQEGQLSVSGESMCPKYWLAA